MRKAAYAESGILCTCTVEAILDDTLFRSYGEAQL